MVRTVRVKIEKREITWTSLTRPSKTNAFISTVKDMTAPRCRSPGRTDLASFFSPLSSHFLSFSFFLSSSLFLSLPFKLYFLLPIFLSFPHPHLSIAFHFPRH